MARTFTYEITILEHHLDTYGHVNNATYLEILEEARWDLVTKEGWGLDRVQREKKGPIILEISMKFHKELRLREKVRIETTCTEYGKMAGTLEQKMLSASGETFCTAQFKMALFDLEKRKLLRPTEEWLKILLGD